MKKKYNNESNDISDWTTAYLKAEARNYHQTIYEVECYGTRDLRMYDAILIELSKRGIEWNTKLTFN